MINSFKIERAKQNKLFLPYINYKAFLIKIYKFMQNISMKPATTNITFDHV